MVDDAGLLEKAAQLPCVVWPERLAILNRQFEHRALEVTHEDLEIVRVHVGMLWGALEEVLGMIDNVLVERGRSGHQDRDRGSLPATGAPRALPCGGDRTRVSGQHHGVERTDIDAELQRIGRDDTEYLPIAHLPFNFAPLPGQIATAIAPDTGLSARWATSRLLEISCQHFGGQAAVGEHERLATPLEEVFRHAPCLVDVASPNTELLVDHGRVVKDDVSPAAGRSVVVHESERFLDKVLR